MKSWLCSRFSVCHNSLIANFLYYVLGTGKIMNLVDVHVVKVIVPAKKINDLVWQKKVMTDCYGRKKEKTITGSKELVDKYVVGYKWFE